MRNIVPLECRPLHLPFHQILRLSRILWIQSFIFVSCISRVSLITCFFVTSRTSRSNHLYHFLSTQLLSNNHNDIAQWYQLSNRVWFILGDFFLSLSLNSKKLEWTGKENQLREMMWWCVFDAALQRMVATWQKKKETRVFNWKSEETSHGDTKGIYTKTSIIRLWKEGTDVQLDLYQCCTTNAQKGRKCKTAKEVCKAPRVEVQFFQSNAPFSSQWTAPH